jgi:hypothetical protein
MLGQNAIADPKRKRGETKKDPIVLCCALAGTLRARGPEVFASRMKKFCSLDPRCKGRLNFSSAS